MVVASRTYEFQFPINIEEALQLILKINTFSDYELMKFVYSYLFETQ